MLQGSSMDKVSVKSEIQDGYRQIGTRASN